MPASDVIGSTPMEGVWANVTFTGGIATPDRTLLELGHDAVTSTRVIFLPSQAGVSSGRGSDDMTDDILRRLGNVEADVKNIGQAVVRIETTLTHVPTKVWLLGSVITVLVGFIALLLGGYFWFGKTVAELILKGATS